MVGIYGIMHELQQGGDVPAIYDNSAEYWDAYDEEVDAPDDIHFCCDGCDRWLPHTDEQPHIVKDPTVDVLVFCDNCYNKENN